MWFQMVLGHLVGDYLVQNRWMALNKSKNTLKGWLAAVIHCVIYTMMVTTAMNNWDFLWIVVVFFSHFIIDKFSLAEIYMHYVKGFGMKDYVNKDLLCQELKHTPKLKSKLNRYDVLEGGFTSLIYTVTDNTMHLIIMYIGYNIIYF